MVAIARYCNLIPIHASTNLAPVNAPRDWYSKDCADSMLIAKKPAVWKGLLNLRTYTFQAPDLGKLSNGFVSAHDLCKIDNFENIKVTEEIKYTIDKLTKNDKEINIDGWAFLENKVSDKQQIYIQITEKIGKICTYGTTQGERVDVGIALNDERYNYSGFSLLIKDAINSEGAKINIIIENDGYFMSTEINFAEFAAQQ